MVTSVQHPWATLAQWRVAILVRIPRSNAICISSRQWRRSYSFVSLHCTCRTKFTIHKWTLKINSPFLFQCETDLCERFLRNWLLSGTGQWCEHPRVDLLSRSILRSGGESFEQMRWNHRAAGRDSRVVAQISPLSPPSPFLSALSLSVSWFHSQRPTPAPILWARAI